MITIFIQYLELNPLVEEAAFIKSAKNINNINTI